MDVRQCGLVTAQKRTCCVHWDQAVKEYDKRQHDATSDAPTQASLFVLRQMQHGCDVVYC